MTVLDLLDTLSPTDLVLPRRLVPVAFAAAIITVTCATVIGFLGGYRLTDTRHASERAELLGEYARQLAVKDTHIAGLTDKIIAMAEAERERDARVDDTLDAFSEILEQIARAVARNTSSAARLTEAANHLRNTQQAAPRPRPAAPPAGKPAIGPPPKSPLTPARPNAVLPDFYKG